MFILLGNIVEIVGIAAVIWFYWPLLKNEFKAIRRQYGDDK